jgi:U-box domain
MTKSVCNLAFQQISRQIEDSDLNALSKKMENPLFSSLAFAFIKSRNWNSDSAAASWAHLVERLVIAMPSSQLNQTEGETYFAFFSRIGYWHDNLNYQRLLSDASKAGNLNLLYQLLTDSTFFQNEAGDVLTAEKISHFSEIEREILTFLLLLRRELNRDAIQGKVQSWEKREDLDALIGRAMAFPGLAYNMIFPRFQNSDEQYISLPILERFIAFGGNVHAYSENNFSWMQLAAESGNIEAVRQLLAARLHIDSIGTQSSQSLLFLKLRTPLELALLDLTRCDPNKEKEKQEKFLAMVQFLIENGASLDRTLTMICNQISTENSVLILSLLQLLLQSGAAFDANTRKTMLEIGITEEKLVENPASKLSTWIATGDTDSINDEVTRWIREDRDSLKIALRSRYLTFYILTRFGDLIDIDAITAEWTDDEKFKMSSLLTPRGIHEIVSRIPTDERAQLLNYYVQKLIPSETNPQGDLLLVKEALIEYAKCCLKNVDHDRSLDSLSTTLLSDAWDLLSKIDIKTLGVAAADPEVQEVIGSYFEAMSDEQLKISVPQLPIDKFVAILKRFSFYGQIKLLGYAREEQVAAWTPNFNIDRTKINAFMSKPTLSDDDAKGILELNQSLTMQISQTRLLLAKLYNYLTIRKIRVSEELKNNIFFDIVKPISEACKEVEILCQQMLAKIAPSDSEGDVADEYLCPISRQLIEDPVHIVFGKVVSPHVYDRASAERAMEIRIHDPLTQINYQEYQLIPLGSGFIGMLLKEACRIKDSEKALAIIDSGAPIDHSMIVESLSSMGILEEAANKIHDQHLEGFRVALEETQKHNDIAIIVRRRLHNKFY